MEANRNYINENIVNISLMAGKLIADGKISVEDHAELTGSHRGAGGILRGVS